MRSAGGLSCLGPSILLALVTVEALPGGRLLPLVPRLYPLETLQGLRTRLPVHERSKHFADAPTRHIRTPADCLQRVGAASDHLSDAQPEQSGAAEETGAEAREKMVEELVTLVAGTDRGADASADQREQAQAFISELGVVGKSQQPRPLANNALLWGAYDVVYTARGANDTGGEPAGGRFRGALGRAIFRTTRVMQNLYEPDVVYNLVQFKLFGFIPGQVSLLGKVAPSEGDKTGDTVTARFGRPEIRIGMLRFSLGPNTSVDLSTTYLDEQIRLGKGGRGSLFVFTRTNDDPYVAELEHPSVAWTSNGWGIPPAWMVWVVMLFWFAGSLAISRMFEAGMVTQAMLSYIAIFNLVMIGIMAVLLVLRDGGVILDNPDQLRNASLQPAPAILAVEPGDRDWPVQGLLIVAFVTALLLKLRVGRRSVSQLREPLVRPLV